MCVGIARSEDSAMSGGFRNIVCLVHSSKQPHLNNTDTFLTIAIRETRWGRNLKQQKQTQIKNKSMNEFKYVIRNSKSLNLVLLITDISVFYAFVFDQGKINTCTLFILLPICSIIATRIIFKYFIRLTFFDNHAIYENIIFHNFKKRIDYNNIIIIKISVHFRLFN